MMKKERMETLKANGIDTSKYFTLLVNEDIPAGTKINIAIDREDNNPVVNQIIEDGYVKNTKLHRRFVAAQYLRMLNSGLGYHGYLNLFYGYMYQFDMMFEEVRILGILEKKDAAAFNERSRFFTKAVVRQVLDDYIRDVKEYIKGLDIKHCKREPYVKIKQYGDVFVDDIDKKVINPMEAARELVDRKYTYAGIYEQILVFKKFMINLPPKTRKSKTWVDAFQKEGAFYTLKNLILFHDVKLYLEGDVYGTYLGMKALNEAAKRYEGYQLNAVLKETIKYNNFDFLKSIIEHS